MNVDSPDFKRRARQAHRIALTKVREVSIVDGKRTWRDIPVQCWTLFITGPVVRDWGFHCPDAGWVFWKNFVDARDAGSIGRGCAQ